MPCAVLHLDTESRKTDEFAVVIVEKPLWPCQCTFSPNSREALPDRGFEREQVRPLAFEHLDLVVRRDYTTVVFVAGHCSARRTKGQDPEHRQRHRQDDLLRPSSPKLVVQEVSAPLRAGRKNR